MEILRYFMYRYAAQLNFSIDAPYRQAKFINSLSSFAFIFAPSDLSACSTRSVALMVYMNRGPSIFYEERTINQSMTLRAREIQCEVNSAGS